jgi:hypothetical protein
MNNLRRQHFTLTFGSHHKGLREGSKEKLRALPSRHLFRTTAQQGRLFAWLQEATLSAQPGNARANQALLPRSSPEGQESLLEKEPIGFPALIFRTAKKKGAWYGRKERAAQGLSQQTSFL